MIVQALDDALLLVEQAAHAGLAAEIIDAWCADGFSHHPNRATLLEAIRLHDDGWRLVDREPTLDVRSGRPHDFITMPDPIKQEVWPRLLDRLNATPAVAALVAEHVLTVYSRHGDDPSWRAFFADVERRRDAALRENDQELRALRRDYAFLYIGDLLSLIFCNGWRQPFEARRYQAQLAGEVLNVSPDPFGGATVALSVEARRLPRRVYESQAELRAEFRAAPILRLVGRAVGVGTPQRTLS